MNITNWITARRITDHFLEWERFIEWPAPAGPKAYGKAMASPNFSPLWYPTVEALIYPTPNRLLNNIEKRENEEKYFCNG